MDKVAQAAANRGEKMAQQGGPSASDDGWIQIQKNTFTAWTNTKLAEVGSKVDQVEIDFRNGVPIIQMMEVVAKKPFGKYNKAPKIKAQEIENLNGAIKFIEGEGLKLINIGANDINDGNLKLILGLLWTIIYHYQVSVAMKEAAAQGKKQGAREALLEWVRSKIPEYDIKNFNSDWTDGRAICALTNAVGGDPWLIPNHRQMMKESGVRNAQTAIDSAYENLGIPKVISSSDLANPNVDELSVMTYVSYFRDAKRKIKEEAKPVKEAAPVKETPPPASSSADNADKDKYAHMNASLPAPWKRDANWREYKGENLGGRLKIRVYYSTTTSSPIIRANLKTLQDVFEREKVHLRPDFEPWVPVDVDMSKETRDKIFDKAGTRKTPLVFIDDEFVGDFDRMMEINEAGELPKLLAY